MWHWVVGWARSVWHSRLWPVKTWQQTLLCRWRTRLFSLKISAVCSVNTDIEWVVYHLSSLCSICSSLSVFLFVFRPPNLVVGALSFHCISSFFLSSVFRQLPSELAERNLTKNSHMLGSECDLTMYFVLLQIKGPKTTYFQRLHNLASTSTACIFRTKHDIQHIIGQVHLIVNILSLCYVPLVL